MLRQLGLDGVRYVQAVDVDLTSRSLGRDIVFESGGSSYWSKGRSVNVWKEGVTTLKMRQI